MKQIVMLVGGIIAILLLSPVLKLVMDGMNPLISNLTNVQQWQIALFELWPYIVPVGFFVYLLIVVGRGLNIGNKNDGGQPPNYYGR